MSDKKIPRPYEPNAILRWFYRRFFSSIQVDSRWTDAVRAASEQGTVVYVMRSISFLDFLCLDFLVKRLGLPWVHFVNDLGLWVWEPFGKGIRRLLLRRQVPEDKALRKTVEKKLSALLFLRGPAKFARVQRRGNVLQTDLLATLVACQRQNSRPILLVPQTFVWSKRPTKTRWSVTDLFFGPSEWPGKLRVFFQFLLNYKNTLLRSGEPFSLALFLEKYPNLTDIEAANKIRYALLRRIERERTLVLGPVKKSPQRIREELLRSHRVRKHALSTARSSGKSVETVLKEADRELKNLCAAQTPFMVGLLHRVLEFTFRRIYSGLVIDEEGLERVRTAAVQGPLVFIPSHKSHVDYLVLSEVFYRHAMSPPLIAAGDNLNFWPLGAILRRGGAFFIRRSFRGYKLYSTLVEAYLRKLIVEGFNIEFFIEGGRSRTGKLLPPKLGLLSMIVDAAWVVGQTKLRFVPVSIGYERIIEERAYLQELSGGEKSKESLGGLLRTPKIFRSKYGRLYMQFGEMIDLEGLAKEIVASSPAKAQGKAEGTLSPTQKRALVQKLAIQTVYEINRVTIVTPAALVATALLANRRRGISGEELERHVAVLNVLLKAQGARMAPAATNAEGSLRKEAIMEAIRLFAGARLVQVHGEGGDEVYSVPEERRMALEYYKNNVVHFFVPSALIANAVLAVGQRSSANQEVIADRVQWLSKLFKHEFVFRSDGTFEENFQRTLDLLLSSGLLMRSGDLVHPAAGSGAMGLALLASMVRPYVESYRLVLRGIEIYAAHAIAKKELLKRTLTLGQRMYLAGEIELRESLSRPKLENAVQAFKDLELVSFPATDDIQIAKSVEDVPETFKEWERKLLQFRVT